MGFQLPIIPQLVSENRSSEPSTVVSYQNEWTFSRGLGGDHPVKSDPIQHAENQHQLLSSSTSVAHMS